MSYIWWNFENVHSCFTCLDDFKETIQKILQWYANEQNVTNN